MKSSRYNKYVDLGKQAVEQIKSAEKLIQSHQSKIASYALKVCDIRHGGKSYDLYTMKDYASDIGMNAKTLQNWVAVYRDILLTIEKTKPTKDEWSKALRVSNTINHAKVAENKVNNAKKGKSKKLISKGEILSMFNDENSVIFHFDKCLQASKRIKNLLVTNDMSSIHKIQMTELGELLYDSIQIIKTILKK